MSALQVPVPRRPFTWTDFLALGDEDKRELVDGELLEVEVPTLLHEWIVSYLVHLLTGFALQHGGKVTASGFKIRISERRGAMPDLQYYKPGRNVPQAGLTEGAPDLAVEVLSPTSHRHDRVRKLEWYASIGLPEYWIVDPEDQSVQRLVLVDTAVGKRWQIAEALDGEGEWRPESFGGMVVSLRTMFTLPE